jgi:protein-disulfide isomerase
MMNRRRLLLALSLAAFDSLGGRLMSGQTAHASTQSQGVDVDAILNDPEAPVGGNPEGDVTIVAFIDYNCPFCKKSDPDLRRLVATDGRIKLISKDWPILAETSVYGARLALAAKYQRHYETAHATLLALHGKQSSEASMLSAVKAAGVDMTRLDADLNAHSDAISALLKRNAAEADALGLKGTPVFLIGPYLVEAALNYDGFAEVVSKFRAQIGK